jgi:carbamoyl-phosphate synthase large subunit
MSTSAQPQVNLLFTSVGRRVELLRAFRQAYASTGIAGNIIGTDIDALAPALQLVDRPYIVPRFSTPEYVPALAEICRREGVSLIFPLIDPDIPILAQQRATLEATGARVAAVGLDAARVTADKWLTVEFFRGLGLATGRAWLPGELDPDRAEYPLFIKPRAGSAAQHTFKVRNRTELAFFAEYVPDAIIQEYLPGPEITSDVVCDPDGTVLGVVSRRRIEVRWGEVAKGVTVYDPIIAAACTRIAAALPATGPITVQCMLKDGVPHFTEINARFGGGAPLGFAAGFDAPAWLLRCAAGQPVEPPVPGSYQIGLSLTRFDDAFFLMESQREQMARHHL